MDPRYIEAATESPRPIAVDTPPVVNWLHELGDAAHKLGAASEQFIAGRAAFEAAKARYAECVNMVAKEQEASNV